MAQVQPKKLPPQADLPLAEKSCYIRGEQIRYLHIASRQFGANALLRAAGSILNP